MNPSGVRIGTPSVTSRGMREVEMQKIGDWMDEVIEHYQDEVVLERVAGEVRELCQSFPCPGIHPEQWEATKGTKTVSMAA